MLAFEVSSSLTIVIGSTDENCPHEKLNVEFMRLIIEINLF